MDSGLTFANLQRKLKDRTAVAGVIGLGYVGLPLAIAVARRAFLTIGFDIDPSKTNALNGGISYIAAVPHNDLRSVVNAKRFRASDDFSEIRDCDVLIICVPTPLTRYREPDLSFVRSTAEVISSHLRAGQLVILESTTYPGTTREVVKPILQASGLIAGRDFFLGFSPEREDPGNGAFETVTIPKVVAGDDEQALTLAETFYGSVVDTVVSVSSTEVAEAVKITENIFRAVNIALVNELKTIFSAMEIDIWEVIEAAKTKPFGYMPFYPGPGLGGHCIPIDPFYLTWKSREFGLATRFIELAGEINLSMPKYVVEILSVALDQRAKIPLSSANILIVGLAYKRNIPDLRESPSLMLMEILESRGARVEYHDPYIEVIPKTREYNAFAGRHSVKMSADELKRFDAILIATDHDNIDYRQVSEHARLIIDTRNVMIRRGLPMYNVVKA